MPPEQALIQQDEVWFAHAKEFGGRHPIRSDEDLGAGLLCKCLTQVQGSGQVVLDETAIIARSKPSATPVLRAVASAVASMSSTWIGLEATI
jgi:hypothetical protein